ILHLNTPPVPLPFVSCSSVCGIRFVSCPRTGLPKKSGPAAGLSGSSPQRESVFRAPSVLEAQKSPVERLFRRLTLWFDLPLGTQAALEFIPGITALIRL